MTSPASPSPPPAAPLRRHQRGRLGVVVPPLDRNGWLVVVSKGARTFGFGLLSVGIGLHFATIGIEPAVAGIILGFALLGTMALTFLIAIFGDRIGRRRFIFAGSLLMMLAVLVPLAGDAPVLLALIAGTGAVAATANESSGLVSADQAILPQTVPQERRTDAFAFYSLVAFVASAVGSAALGPLVWIADAMGATEGARYNGVFFAYALAGLLAAIASLGLDTRAEVPHHERIEGFAIKRSRRVVAEITALFAYDSFATGLILHGFLAYWFATVHGLGAGELALLFSLTAVLGAFSFPVAAWLANRFGLIATMVFTNGPANLLLVAMAFVPAGPIGSAVAVALYAVRSFLGMMDVPMRQSYVMAVVEPAERTATAGVTSLVRSGAMTAGPFVGALLLPLGLWAPIAVSGALKVGYNVFLWRLFKTRLTPEEQAKRDADA